MTIFLLSASGWIVALATYIWLRRTEVLVVYFESDPKPLEGGCENCSCGGSCRS